MNTAKTDSVRFTAKRQIVIPLRLRKEFHIEDGTRAMVEATPEGILLKPVTTASIQRARGILRRRPGQKPLAKEWAEYKQQTRELEETKHGVPGAQKFRATGLLAR